MRSRGAVPVREAHVQLSKHLLKRVANVALIVPCGKPGHLARGGLS
jgi:hypothetical protein